MPHKTPRLIIDLLWRDHCAARFPKGSAIEMIELDALTAGCVHTFLTRKGKLDLWRTAILGLCYRDLAMAVTRCKGEQMKYFARLEEMARWVLQAVRDNTKQT